MNSLLKMIFRAAQLQQKPKYDIFQKTLFLTLASSTNLGLDAVLISDAQYLSSISEGPSHSLI